MEVMSALSAVGTAISIAKNLNDVAKRYSDAELKLQLADLMIALSEAKVAIASAQQELLAKDQEIAQLKEVKASKFRTIEYRGYSFGIGADGKSIGRPFCPVCEKAGTQIQMTRATSRHDLCPKCKATYSGHPYMLPENLQGLGEDKG